MSACAQRWMPMHGPAEARGSAQHTPSPRCKQLPGKLRQTSPAQIGAAHLWLLARWQLHALAAVQAPPFQARLAAAQRGAAVPQVASIHGTLHRGAGWPAGHRGRSLGDDSLLPSCQDATGTAGVCPRKASRRRLTLRHRPCASAYSSFGAWPALHRVQRLKWLPQSSHRGSTHGVQCCCELRPCRGGQSMHRPVARSQLRQLKWQGCVAG
jgi:hypothetical protein